MPCEFSRTPPPTPNLSLLSLQKQVYTLFLCLEAQDPINLSVMAWLQQLQVVKLLGEPCPVLHKRQNLGICILESFPGSAFPLGLFIYVSLWPLPPVAKCL